MKKKISIFIAFLIFFPCMLLMVACGEKNYNLSFIVDNETYYTVIIDRDKSITMPEEPSKVGYAFDGWYLDNNIWNKPFTIDSLINISISGNIKVYSKWNAIEYTAYFYADNELIDSSIFTLDDLTIRDIPNVPERIGYNGRWENYSISANDLTINAIYTPSIYNVYYDENGGNEITNDTYTYGIGNNQLPTSEVIKKTGYIFKGWEDQNGEIINSISNTLYGDIYLIAKWEAIEYTAYFYIDNELLGTAKFTLDDNTILNCPNLPERIGYDGRWEYTIKAENIVVNAVYTIKLLTVSWNNYDNTLIKTTKVEYNKTPKYDGDVPTRNSDERYRYTFSGWSPSISNITENTIYTATFTPIEFSEYTIQYNANGGTGAPNSQTKLKGQNITLSIDIPTRADHKFVGWNNIYEDTIYQSGDVFSSDINVTFYAMWEDYCTHCHGIGTLQNQITCSNCSGFGKIPEEIWVNCNGCNGSGKISYLTVCSSCNGWGGDCLCECTCGYRWWANQTNSRICANCGRSVVATRYTTCSSCSGSGSVTAYKTCASCNGSKGRYVTTNKTCPKCSGSGKITQTITCTYCNGQKIVKPVAPTYTSLESRMVVLTKINGYEYSIDGINWQNSNIFDSLKPSTEYTLYQRIATIDNVPFGVASSPLIITTKSSTLFYITYDLDGGTNNNENPIQYYTTNADITLLSPTREHYDFAGWLYNGHIITEINSSWAVDIDLVANWNLHKYSINYDLNGGTTTNPTFYTIETDNIILSDATKKGYSFVGWIYENSEQPMKNIVVPINLYTTFLYIAVWEANVYTLSFYTNGGSVINPITAKCDTILNIERPILNGKSFVGWFDQALINEIDLSKMPTESMTVYAKWIDYSIEITYERDSAISGLSPLTFESFGLKAKDTDGNDLIVTIELLDGEFDIGNTISVRAKANGLYSMSKSKLFNSVKIYGTPTLNYDVNKKNINLSDELTPSLFSLIGQDSFNNDTIVSLKIIDEIYTAGDYVSIELKSEDITGNVYSVIIDNIKVYGNPTIYRDDEIVGIKDTDIISSELFGIIANDSFNNSIICATSIYSGILKAGNIINIKSTAIDEFGNCSDIIFEVKVYGAPTISDAKLNQFKLFDDISIESLGINVVDSFGIKINHVRINLESERKVAGEILRYRIIATDCVGNISNKTVEVKLYDIPTILYDVDKLYIKENEFISSELFNVKALDSFGDVMSVITKIKSGNKIGGQVISIEFSTSDCVGNRKIVLIENIRIYSVNDIQLTFNKALTDKISVNSKGEEFNAIAKDSFNEPCSISIIAENSNIPVGGTISNIFIVAKDKAGNVVKSELINNIKIYDKPTICFIRNSNYCYETNDSLYSLFIAEDSFGENLDYELNVTGNRIVGNTIFVSIISYDILNNCSTFNIELLVVEPNQTCVKLINDFNKTECYKGVNVNSEFDLGISSTNLLETNFIGWYSENGIAYTDSTGKGLDIWKYNNPVVLYAMFDCFDIDNNELIGVTSSLKNYFGDILVPRGVTSIGNNAFADCYNLTNIVIPDSVTNIGINAFLNCKNLEKLIIPNSVTEIGLGALKGCSSIRELCIPFVGKLANKTKASVETLFGYIFGKEIFDNSLETKQYYQGYVSQNGGSYPANSETYYVPKSLTKMSVYGGNLLYGAFYGCSYIEQIELGDLVNTIGNAAFFNCIKLESLSLGKNIQQINTSMTFYGCDLLKNINISSLDTWCNISWDKSFSYYLYLNGVLLTNLVLPSELQIIPKNTFKYCESIKEIIIPDSVTDIEQNAFYKCTNLEKLVIGGGVKHIYSSAFGYCTGLTSIDILCKDAVFETSVFSECNMISRINIQKIEDWCSIEFKGYYSSYEWGYVYNSNPLSYAKYLYINNELIKNLVIPETVVNIKSGSFNNCINIETITFIGNVVSIGEKSFAECVNLKQINIPKSCLSIGYLAFYNCNNLEKVIVSSIEDWCVINFSYRTSSSYNTLYAQSNPLFYARSLYLNNEQITELNFNESVTKINKIAFINFEGLIKVELGPNITSIDDNAFYGCIKLFEVVNHSNLTLKLGNSNNGYISYYAKKIITDDNSNLQIVNDKHLMYIDGNNTYYVSYLGDEKNVVLPEIDYDYSIYQNAFYNNKSISSITIPNNIIKIGKDAFKGCDNLVRVNIFSLENWCKINFEESTNYYYSNPLSYAHNLYLNGQLVTNLVLPNSITSINQAVFYLCQYITSITIPETLKTISKYAFYGCNGLSSVHIFDLEKWCNISFETSSNPLNYAHALYLNDTLVEELCISSITYIRPFTFNGCHSLKVLTMDDGINTIGNYAFAGCINLSSVRLSDNLKSIGSYAFSNCKQLKTLLIPSQVSSIGEQAFYSCTGLTDISIPNNVKYIEKYTFASCNNLINVVLPDSLTSISQYAFNSCRQLKTIIIPSRVSSIGEYAFSGCYNLVEVINKSSLSITAGSSNNGSIALYAKKVLTSESESCLHIIGDEHLFLLDTNGNYYIAYLGKDPQITLPSTEFNYSINSYAFYYSFISSVTIPNSVIEIGECAFYGCKNLTDIQFGTNTQLTTIMKNAFRYCSITSFEIPYSINSIGDYAFEDCYKLIEIINHSNLTLTMGSTMNGYVAAYSKSILSQKEEDKFELIEDKHLMYIDGNNSYYVSYLGDEKNVVLPETDYNYSIYQYAFYNNKDILSVTISDSVLEIENYAFKSCTNLEDIYIGSGVKSIKYGAFDGCNSLKSIIFGNNSQLERIGSYAFENCFSLSEITIPYSVNFIDYHAFFQCVNLKNIVFENICTWFISQSSSYIIIENQIISNPSLVAEYITSYYVDKYWQKG